MIQNTDLRIGNLVSLYDKPFKVIEIGANTVIIQGNKGSVEVGLEDLKPYLISEYWLLKMGFGKYADSSVCNGWFIGHNPMTHDYLFDLTWMKNEDGTLAECFYRNGHFVMKYVHSIQNLFHALCGEELTIK